VQAEQGGRQVLDRAVVQGVGDLGSLRLPEQSRRAGGRHRGGRHRGGGGRASGGRRLGSAQRAHGVEQLTGQERLGQSGHPGGGVQEAAAHEQAAACEPRIHRDQFRDEGHALLGTEAHVDEDRVVFARRHGAGLGQGAHRVDAVPARPEHPGDHRPEVRGIVDDQDARGMGDHSVSLPCMYV
jgi:hypothetical protein